MFPQDQILNQIRRRRVLEPPFATPPIALQQEAEQSKSDPWSERLPDGRTVNEAIMETLRGGQSPAAPRGDPPLSRIKVDGPSNAEMEQILSRNPEMRDIAIGEDYGNDRPGLYRVRPNGDSVGIEPFDPRKIPSGDINASSGGFRDAALGSTRPGNVPSGIIESAEGATRPWKVGGSLERDPLRREQARIRAMLENPASEISQSGAVSVPHPMGKLKGALLGALFGLAQGDRNTSLAERLAAGAAGTAVGAFKPRAVQDWKRRMEVEDAQGQLAQQMKLSTGQAQLDNLRAETQSRMADLMVDPETGQIVKRPPRRAPQYVERSDGVYEISEAHPNGRRIGNIPSEAKARSRGSVHYETREDGVYAIYADEDGQIKSQRVEGVPGKPSEREDKREANRAKREAGLKEASSYDDEANAVDAQANSLNEHIRKLEEGMATIPQFALSTTAVDEQGEPVRVSNPARDDHIKAIADLKKQQQDLRDKATQLRKDARKARSDAESIPGTEGTPSAQTGRRWSASKWAAANPGGDVEAAKAAAKAAKYTVVE